MKTVLQLLYICNAEVAGITEHLGHTQVVHKAWCRPEASTVELTKVAKVVIEKDGGVEFTNKKMKDLTANVFIFILIIFWLVVVILHNTQNNFNPTRDIRCSKIKQMNFLTLCIAKLNT